LISALHFLYFSCHPSRLSVAKISWTTLLRYISWLNDNLKMLNWTARWNYELIADILSDSFLTQMALQPTRESRICDFVLTNNSDMVCDVEVVEPISDHKIITFSMNVYSYHRISSEREFYDFNKADWSFLNELFEHIQWHYAFLSKVKVPMK